MPTGYTGLWLRNVDITNVGLWNSVLEQVTELIKAEFLPSIDLKPDDKFEHRSSQTGYFTFGFGNLLRPRRAESWHYGDYFGEKGGVFVLGPFSQENGGLKNIMIFCSFVMAADVRDFFSRLDRFVEEKTKEILEQRTLVDANIG